MNRVLITGASGFIGRHTLPLLVAAGFEVFSAGLEDDPGLPTEVAWVQGNLLDSKFVEKLFSEVKPTHLLHLAWFTEPGNYWTSWENLHCVRAGLELIRAFAEHDGRRVVVAGTCAEYDWNSGECSEETTPLRPATLYGASKHGLHVIADSFCRNNEIELAWGRVFFLFGPGEHPNRVIPAAISSLLQGRRFPCSDGQQLRDFLYVEDVASALAALVCSDVIGPVNIAGGNPLKLKEVLTIVGSKLDRLNLIGFGEKKGSSNEPAELTAAINRLTNELEWKPRYTLQEGLEKTISWWRENLKQKS